jgi:hypothetical protein
LRNQIKPPVFNNSGAKKMPRYFFHLTFGDRLVPDEEGIDLPSRVAAREEAIAAARELSARAPGSPRSRWASWFLQVADDKGGFLRLPLGHPALEVVSPENPWRQSPVTVEPLSPVAVETPPAEARPMLAVMRRILARRQEMSMLIKENNRLRQELAREFRTIATTRLRAQELLSRAQATYSQTMELQAGNLPSPAR